MSAGNTDARDLGRTYSTYPKLIGPELCGMDRVSWISSYSVCADSPAWLLLTSPRLC